jgi:hypothetical protein
MTAEAKHRGDTARRHRDREAEGRHRELSFSKVPRTAMAGLPDRACDDWCERGG